MEKRYKFLREGLKSDYNGFQWEIGKWYKTDCLELCHGFNCSDYIADALYYVQGEILAEVETKGKHFKDDSKSTWEEMRIKKVWKWTPKDSVELAIFAAESVLHIFEKEYPDDKRPRIAIEVAKKGGNADAARAAIDAAADAADAAWAARAARAAAGAADAAWAARAAWAAINAADAAWAAWAAAWAADKNVKVEIQDWILSRLENKHDNDCPDK